MKLKSWKHRYCRFCDRVTAKMIKRVAVDRVVTETLFCNHCGNTWEHRREVMKQNKVNGYAKKEDGYSRTYNTANPRG